MKTLIITNPLCLQHEPGSSHIESPIRLKAILDSLQPLPPQMMLCTTSRSATLTELLRVHSPEYITHLLSLRGKYGSLDQETFLSPCSIDAALAAAGAAIELVDALLDGTAQNGMALVRPPGHHAGRNAGMGYCVINHIAVATAHAHDRGIKRVLIIDWDAHHGNGTHEIFSSQDNVLLIDLHQDGLYPETGSLHECGIGSGQGYTINIPLPPESNDLDYLYAFEKIVLPAAKWYQPELVLVSCGFDAHTKDPEAGMSLTSEGFGWLTLLARQISEDSAQGRLGLILEGGYLIPVLGDCTRTCINALTGGYSMPMITYPLIRDRSTVEKLLPRISQNFPDHT